MAIKAHVSVPGTTANCGPGFDSVGIACTIYNHIELELVEQGNCTVTVSGEGEDNIPVDDRNIAVKAVRAVFDRVKCSNYGISLKMDNNIPLARGLGSSAAAIVGGLVAANQATGNQLTKQDLFEIATAIEGHPDNVAPAIFGGITISLTKERKPHCMRFIPPNKLVMVVAVPEFTLSTHKARQVLPSNIPFQDAVFNVGRTAMLIGALCSGEYQHLRYALEDKLHQPFRQSLIPGMKEVFDAAIQCGAYGAALSGAGPCLISYTDKNTDEIGVAMTSAFAQAGIKAKYLVLNIDQQGAVVIK
ncbi:Homoserine kinase [bioreactor metagenome]|uniref:Homoserine kinase n=1 Tax=bioreactor metagenome TaxID=1076179 RepID=A0A644T0C4_9ZZZZ|nr:homoserine kinase [Negativicutes bacterium]